jgi:hypothetical protein
MKNWLTSNNKFVVTSAIALVLGSILMLTTISWSKPTGSASTNLSLCSPMTETSNTRNSLQFHPIKIVAEPWRGEHNVYAVFALPLAYRNIYHQSNLMIKGSDTVWNVTLTDGRKYGVSTVPEGKFLVIGFFRTRLALLYLISGKFSYLKDPCNWTLYFFP